MELMNELTIKSTVPKIIETPNHFIMNTQVYDKQTLKPIPMKFSMPVLNNYSSMILDTSVHDVTKEQTTLLARDCQRIGNYKNIIKDKFDPNVFYLIAKWNSYDSQVILRIREDNKEYIIEKQLVSNQFGNTEWTNKGDFKILYETDTDFIFEYKGDYYGHTEGHSHTCYTLGKLNKKTFTPTYYLTNNRNYINQTYLLEQSNDIGYILRYSYNTFLVYKVNTSSNILSQIGNTITTGGKNLGSNPVKIGDYYYFLTDINDTEKGRRYAFNKLKLNTIDDTIAYETIEISNYDNYKMDSLDTATAMNFDYRTYHQLQTFEKNGVTYISCTIYGYPNSFVSLGQHKHVLFKVTGNTIEIIHIVPLTDGCKGVLYLNEDYSKPIFVMSNSCLFYSFDATNQKLVNTFKIGGVFIVVGFDSLGRFIVQHTNGTIEILTDTNACILQADFAEELYDKDNASKIDTTVSFYAKNFLDEYLETNVKLTLTGPVVFKENNEKTLVISTLKTGLRTVPVTITGYGNIEVIITQNT